MQVKLVLRLIPTFLLVFPLVVGLGGADYAIDWGPGTKMQGITVWADYYPWGMGPKVHGLGIEAEGRDLNFNRPSGISKMRQDTGMAGVIYSYPGWPDLRPYAKVLFGIGSIDFPPIVPNYTHDTFLVTAPAGGLDVRIWKHVWLRGDYEYQFWHHTFGTSDLTPMGASFGFLYDFRPPPTPKR